MMPFEKEFRLEKMSVDLGQLITLNASGNDKDTCLCGRKTLTTFTYYDFKLVCYTFYFIYHCLTHGIFVVGGKKYKLEIYEF